MVSQFELVYAGSYEYEKKDKETKKPTGVKARAITLLEFNQEKQIYTSMQFYIDNCTIDFSKLELLKPCLALIDISMSSDFKKLVDIKPIGK